jgi:hypothetical protein
MKRISIRLLHLILLSLVFFAVGLTSCYYNSEEELYPEYLDCNTLNITYQNFVSNLMAQKCNTCHNSIIQSGGVNTSEYNSLLIVVNNGRLKGAINHQQGYAAMPQGQGKLPFCELAKLNSWINNGSPEQ